MLDSNNMKKQHFTVKPPPQGGGKGNSTPLPPKKRKNTVKLGWLYSCNNRNLPAQCIQFFEVGVDFEFLIVQFFDVFGKLVNMCQPILTENQRFSCIPLAFVI